MRLALIKAFTSPVESFASFARWVLVRGLFFFRSPARLRAISCGSRRAIPRTAVFPAADLRLADFRLVGDMFLPDEAWLLAHAAQNNLRSHGLTRKAPYAHVRLRRLRVYTSGVRPRPSLGCIIYIESQFTRSRDSRFLLTEERAHRGTDRFDLRDRESSGWAKPTAKGIASVHCLSRKR